MAANQVTVATPGPAGATGLVYEGLWVAASVYQVRDLVRFTDGNLYVCNVQHTATTGGGGNDPVQDATTWTLFIQADDAFQWATKAKHTSITDSVGNGPGYSALHQKELAADWAKLTTDAVRNDADGADVDYSAKAWAIGGTEVTQTASRGAAKEWAVGTGRIDHQSTGGYSAKEYATGTTVAEGSAKEWAQTTGAAIDTTYSSKEYAQGSVLAAGGSSKNWAQLATTPTTTATDASAKEWATGVSTHKNEGSAKDWAIYTAGDVRGASAGSMSAKEWAIGVLGRGVSGEGSAKDWATRLAATVDNAGYSAQEWAVGTTASTGGSAKDWAIYTAADVRGAGSGEMSAKEWAVGVLGRGVANEGSSKDWATRVAATVDNAEYSAKEYSQGSVLAAGGSSKNWAQLATTPTTTATDASAKEWAIGTATHKNDGSAKEWAVYTSGDVRGGSAGDMSSKEWAVGTQGRGVSGEGSSKDWATRTGATVDNAEYSAKEYAFGTTVAAGSAKDWAILAEDSVVDGSSGYSALHWAAKASNSQVAAKASAAAVANSFDSFDDTYLGSMSDAVVFTASSSSGLLITSTAHGLVDTQIIRVINSGGGLPGNLSADTDYYVRDKTTNNFKLATSSGGTVIAYSSTGSGTNTWVYADFATPTSSSWAINSSTITVASNVGIRVGQVVSGTGIPTSPKPNVLSISGVSIVISENMAAAGSSVAVTFANKGVYGTFNTTKDGPSTDNDGDALADGMLYFNTTDNNMMVYKTTGAQWIAASSSGGVSLVMHKVVASGSETSFVANTFSPTLTYTVNSIAVFLNGVKLDATDYTATNGNDITGLSALAASDELVVMAFKTFEVADAVSAASGGTFGGAVTFGAGFTVTDESTDTSCYPLFVTAATGSVPPKTGSNLTFNSNTGILTATGFAGPVTGNVTGNASGTAATVTGAAQSAITSVGTLTTLTVDNVIVNGTTIGHTSDTDLLTLTSGNLAVAGDLETSTTGKIIQRGEAFMKTLHNSWVMGG